MGGPIEVVSGAASFPDLEFGTLTDFDDAATLLQRSWAGNRERPMLYTADFLRWFLSCPSEHPSIAPALFANTGLKAFVCGTPRKVAVGDRNLVFLLMTFFTVAPELRGKGVGCYIWSECLRLARTAGYDGTIHFCVDGNVSNFVTNAGARHAGAYVTHLRNVSYVMRYLKPQPTASGPTENADEAIDVLLHAAAKIDAGVSLRRRWTEAEAVWYLTRPEAVWAVHRTGRDVGILAGYVMEAADAGHTACVFLDEVHWCSSDESAKAALVTKFLSCAAQKAKIVVAPLLGFYDPSPLQQLGFRSSLRLLHAYETTWVDLDKPEQQTSIYLDVL